MIYRHLCAILLLERDRNEKEKAGQARVWPLPPLNFIVLYTYNYIHTY